MMNIVDTLYQTLDNSGKLFQAEIFEETCNFKNIEVDGEALTITTELVHLEKELTVKIGFDEKQKIALDCTCERDKPCMHSLGFFLYCRSNHLFSKLESKAVRFKSITFEELLKTEELKKLASVHYKIEKLNDESYKFNCSLIDHHNQVYSNVKMSDDIKIVDGQCILYTTDKRGFYFDNDPMLNKFLRVLFDDISYSKSDVLYTMQSMDAYHFAIKIEREM